MDWILASFAGLSALAAIVSALASRRSASNATASYRPYIAITANSIVWSGTTAVMQVFITNSGPAPGRITGQHNVVGLPNETRISSGGETSVDVIYPAEKETTSFRLGVEVGCTAEVRLEYENLAATRRFWSSIEYKLPPAPGDPTISARDGN
ncbi:MAG: hypothetical protein WD184_03800 [Acidimicrobiia bacterium]